MKSYYVYLATFVVGDKEYLYVGSHAWNGPKGVIDESYATSSHIARQYKWRWTRMQILEEGLTPDTIRQREAFWINRYAQEFGIADVAVLRASRHCRNVWIEKWRAGGKLLNCHDNSCEHATKVARDKMLRGELSDKQIKNFDSLKTRILPLVELAHTPEALKKAVEHRNYKEIIKKGKETLKSKRKRYLIDDTFVGDFEEVAEYLGCAKDNASKWLRGYQDLPKRCGIHTYKEL